MGGASKTPWAFGAVEVAMAEGVRRRQEVAAYHAMAPWRQVASGHGN